MTPLAEYFTKQAEKFPDDERGMKKRFAESLGITQTWLSLLISGKKLPSATLSKQIEELTKKKIKRKDLRPDLF